MSRHVVDWDDQRAFLAVLEGGSLSAAARMLGVAQPTVRNRIEALERALETPLFTRSVNGLVPTEQARLLGVHVRDMALASEAFVRTASAAPGEIAGTVRISVSEFVGAAVLPAMLPGLRQSHPGLAIEIALSNEAADLPGQEADIAVRMHRPTQGALIARHVGTIPLAFFAHRDYVTRRGAPASLDELAGHELIGSDRTRADFTLMNAAVPTLGRHNFKIRTDSHPAQFAAIKAALGIGALQQPLGLSDPALVAILPEIILHRMDCWIVAHEDLRHAPRIHAVFDHLVTEFTRYCAGASFKSVTSRTRRTGA